MKPQRFAVKGWLLVVFAFSWTLPVQGMTKDGIGQGVDNVDLKELHRNLVETMRKEEAKKFVTQKKKDTLRLLSDNSMLPHEFRAIPGAPILLVVAVERWDEPAEGELDRINDVSYRSVVNFEITGDGGKLLPLLSSFESDKKYAVTSLTTTADMYNIAMAWVVPDGDSPRRIQIKAKLVPEGGRKDFGSRSEIELEANYMSERVLGENDGQLLKAYGSSRGKPMDQSEAPTGVKAQQSTHVNAGGFLTHMGPQGQKAFLHRDGDSFSTYIFNPKWPSAGPTQISILTSASGTFMNTLIQRTEPVKNESGGYFSDELVIEDPAPWRKSSRHITIHSKRNH